jgi:serine protease Do
MSGRLRRTLGLGVAIALVIGCSLDAYAQTDNVPRRKPRLEKPAPLALSPQHTTTRRLSGTAFFVDEAGHMLTARHAVENCSQVTVVKEGIYIRGRVQARDSRYDLALLSVSRTYGLAAVFPQTTTSRANDMVFAGAYDMLAGLSLNGGVLSNARVTSSLGGSEEGHIAIDSDVVFGASGAPVLDGRGLVQGLISRRTQANRVLAVGAPEMKAFLASNGVRFVQDDRPQLAGTASRARRAASLSAKVTCVQN